MTAEIEISRVTKLYGQFRAVDDLSLTIRQGSFVSLLGASGAGKSTVLRMIGGFELPDYGTIRIQGEDVTLLPPYRRRVNTVFQNYALFPHMTAAENVDYGLRQERVPRAERTERVREALRRVDLLHLADRMPQQMSGGQQQRIALARALIKRPAVLLLDEPLGALDRKLRSQMQIELKLLQRELGLTFVFVTHDQEEALAMSDSIVVLRGGRIEQQGDPITLYDEPATAFIADFMGKQNLLAGWRVPGSAAMTLTDGTRLVAERVVPETAAAGEVYGAVRPEHVCLSADEPQSALNRLPARLAASVLLGDAIEHVLVLHDGREILARCRRGGPDLVPEPGSNVWVHWPPKAFSLLPHEVLGTGITRGARGARA